MVMGADVSHPGPESRGSKPSIAAVVASVEPKAANYEVEIRIQDGDQNEVSYIVNFCFHFRILPILCRKSSMI